MFMKMYRSIVLMTLHVLLQEFWKQPEDIQTAGSS